MRALRRQSRAIVKLKEMQLLLLSLVVAMSCLSAMLLFTTSVKHQVSSDAASFLGADKVLKSAIRIAPAFQQRARRLLLKQSVSLRFFSMAAVGERLQLVEVVAVKDNFPLRGVIKITIDGVTRSVQGAPKPGNVWVSSRLLPLLGVKLGEKIAIGEADFTVSAIVSELPGLSADFLNISPSVVMPWQSVNSTEVVKPGSRLSYQWLLAGSNAALKKLTASLRLTRQQQWLSGEKSLPMVNRLVVDALDYFRLGSLVCLLLTGVSLSLASQRFATSQQQSVALLRCFGASFYQILRRYLTVLLWLCLQACLIGIVIGYLMEQWLVHSVVSLATLASQPLDFLPALQSLLTGMGLILSFSLCYLVGLKQVSAVRLLQQTGSNLAGYHRGLMLLGLAGFFGLCYAVVPSLRLVGGLFLCLALFGLLIFTVIFLIFKPLKRLQHRLPLMLRFGVANITRDWALASIQVAAVGLAVFVMLSLYLLSSVLLSQWQAQLPLNAPNFFVMNIQPSQLPAVKKYFTKQGIERSVFYQVTRGRLSHINDVPVSQALGVRFKKVRALQRELNLSSSASLPVNNKVVSGQFARPAKDGGWVSVEQGVAKRIGLHLGDRLTFAVSGRQVIASVTSIRSVDWVSFKPNFFFLFQKGQLSQLPKTAIASFYLPPDKQRQLTELMNTFRNVTLIDMAGIMRQMQSLLSIVTKGLQWVSAFCLMAGGVIVMLAICSYAELSRKLRFLLGVFGLSHALRRQIMLSESFLLGFIAGLLALIAAVSLNYYLAKIVFHIDLHLSWWWLLVPLLLAAVMTGLVRLFN